MALDGQASSADPINIRWGGGVVEVLAWGEELSRCRHLETGRELEVLTDYLSVRNGEVWCQVSTDYRLPVAPGEELRVVRRLSDRALVKKNGVIGWYFGRLDEKRKENP